MKKEVVVQQIKDRINEYAAKMLLLEDLAAKLVDLDLEYESITSGIDINWPANHEIVTTIMQRIAGGKWNKEYSGSYINYINTTYHPTLQIRIYGSPPPPSCKLVEYEEEVPAQPARKVKKVKIVCDEPSTPAAT
jgi:hypothetical protein